MPAEPSPLLFELVELIDLTVAQQRKAATEESERKARTRRPHG